MKNQTKRETIVEKDYSTTILRIGILTRLITWLLAHIFDWIIPDHEHSTQLFFTVGNDAELAKATSHQDIQGMMGVREQGADTSGVAAIV